MKYLNLFGSIVIVSGLLGPVLWGFWNYGVLKFFPFLPPVEWLDATIVMLGAQTLSLFSLRNVEKHYIPVYIPFGKDADDVKGS